MITVHTVTSRRKDQLPTAEQRMEMVASYPPIKLRCVLIVLILEQGKIQNHMLTDNQQAAVRKRTFLGRRRKRHIGPQDLQSRLRTIAGKIEYLIEQTSACRGLILQSNLLFHFTATVQFPKHNATASIAHDGPELKV